MRYVTIGSGSAVPQVERSAPCHLIRLEDQVIVVDLGPGSVWGLLRHGGVDPTDIDLILFTHLHMDHCADLAPLLFALRSRTLVRTKPLMILGPEGLHRHYADLQGIWDHRVGPEGFELTMREWGGEVISLGKGTLDAAPTSHSMPNLAWRIDGGDDADCGVVLTGDGSSTRELVALGNKAPHVLVAESAAAPGEHLEGHMNPSQAGDLARECRSGKLILNHINPGATRDAILKEAMARFDGEVVVAEDGMEVKIQ